MQSAVALGKLHPMQAKKNLAWAIVRDFHSADGGGGCGGELGEAVSAAGRERGCAGGGGFACVRRPVSEPETEAGPCRLPKLLHWPGLASSAGEATRKLGRECGQREWREVQREAVCRGVKVGGSVSLRLGKKSVRVEWVS